VTSSPSSSTCCRRRKHICAQSVLLQIGFLQVASPLGTSFEMAAGDCPSARDSPMTSEQCLEIFRHNLLDIGIHPSPYGTHSFRRGGCQWLASVRRWKLRRICDWGGWSTEFSSLTIVKYLISWNDDPTETRDNFFNPDQAPSLLCYHCGRSCSCA